MTTYRLVHSPWTTREPYELCCDMNLDEAKEALQRRASLIERHYGASCAIAGDGMSMEISDDEALMIGDYQGITSLEAE